MIDRAKLIEAMTAAGWINAEEFVNTCDESELLEVAVHVIDNPPADSA